jgi:hypothetical protein
MTKSSGRILDGESRSEGRDAGTAPRNLYAASVALLWTTALRAAAPPSVPRRPMGRGKCRRGNLAAPAT